MRERETNVGVKERPRVRKLLTQGSTLLQITWVSQDGFSCTLIVQLCISSCIHTSVTHCLTFKSPFECAIFNIDISTRQAASCLRKIAYFYEKLVHASPFVTFTYYTLVFFFSFFFIIVFFLHVTCSTFNLNWIFTTGAIHSRYHGHGDLTLVPVSLITDER